MLFNATAETIYEIANVAAYAVDDLNINDKGKLERKLYKLSNKKSSSSFTHFTNHYFRHKFIE